MRNEANREVCGATANRKCETKPIRRGGGHSKNAWATGAKRSQSGGVQGEGNQDAKRSQSAGGLAHAGTVAGEAFTNARCAKRSQSGGVRGEGNWKMRNEANPPRGGGHGKNAWVRGAKRSQSHLRTVRQSGNPLCFQYRTGVERFERMCMNRLAEIVVTNRRNSSAVADFEAVAVNVRNRGVIGNADQHPSLQDALQMRLLIDECIDERRPISESQVLPDHRRGRRGLQRLRTGAPEHPGHWEIHRGADCLRQRSRPPLLGNPANRLTPD